MPSVVFLRGVNVGGHKAFPPSVVAKKLEKLDVKSIGAAGTFIVRRELPETTIRKEFLKQLPFDAHIMICSGRDLLDLVARSPLPAERGFQGSPRGSDASMASLKTNDENIRPFVSVLEKRPPRMPPLPIHAPDTKDWQVAVIAVRGCFAVSLHRRTGKNLLYPNEVVEKRFGVAATTRGWPTILTLAQNLKE